MSDTHDKMECQCHKDIKEESGGNDRDRHGDTRQCQLGSADQVGSDWFIPSSIQFVF